MKIEYFPSSKSESHGFQTLKRTLGQQQLHKIITRYNKRDHAKPGTTIEPPHFRVRTDKVDSSGRVTLRHGTLLCHILIGRQHKGTKMRLYIANCEVRVITHTGELLRHVTNDPTKRSHGLNRENNYTPEGSHCPR